MLENVRIILIGTSHPGNIGSVARAMKTMALSDLVLVNPKCAIDEKSLALSAGASDILNDHKVFSTLEEAVAECGLVIGASARQRTYDWPMLNPREVGDKVVKEACMYPVALVFGRENSGLTNDELQKCQFHVFIPANPDYSSLNLAMAVQILSYEVRMSFLNEIKPQAIQKQYPLAHEIEYMFKHLEEMLIDIHFIRVNHPGQVMQKLRRFFAHARPETIELRMWRGIFTNIQRSIISATVEGSE